MSHQYYNPATTRLQRSELAVPGSSPKMFEKALNSNADYIFLDLEDAVSPNDKLSARENIIKVLNEINWREKAKLFRYELIVLILIICIVMSLILWNKLVIK